jgi:hypothetical protein
MRHPPYVLIPPEDYCPSDYYPIASEPHRYLAAAISDLSENYYCAGWLIDCEWVLLDMLEGRIGRSWGLGEVTDAETENLRSIRAACDGGWVAMGPYPVSVVPSHADEIEETRAHWGGR